MTTKQSYSVRIDPELWKNAKVTAAKNNETLSELVERLLKKELEK